MFVRAEYEFAALRGSDIYTALHTGRIGAAYRF
jgi:hypothetical protein